MGFLRRLSKSIQNRLRRLAIIVGVLVTAGLLIDDNTRNPLLWLGGLALGLWLTVRVLGVLKRVYDWLRPVGGNCRMSRLDRMDGSEFESWIARVLRGDGFEVRNIRHRGDFGTDVIATSPRSGRSVAIQAKRFKSNVGNDAVQQAIAGGQFHDSHRAAVVTQSRFTRAAKRQAAAADPPVILIDRDSLRRMASTLRRTLRD